MPTSGRSVVVLHEMLTGQRTFGGETISETLASVLRDLPDTDGLPEATPASVRHLLSRCLDRDRDTRLRDIGEARIALSPTAIVSAPASNVQTSESTVPAEPPAASRLPWIVAGVAVLAAVALAWMAFGRGEAEPAGEIRANIAPPEGQEFVMVTESAGALNISPDGTRIVFTATSGNGRNALYVRSLGSTSAQLIPQTEGATFPFWSPDSRHIAFFADDKLKKLDLSGGAPMTIASAGDGRGGTWKEDGTILFAPDTQSPIMRVSSAGALGEAVTALDPSRRSESTHRFPCSCPTDATSCICERVILRATRSP